MRVLIVDDSVVVRSAIRASLEGDARIEVVGAASNGKIALDLVQQKAPDLIILDLEMPVLDGIATLKALRALNSSAKVIVFSSLTARGSEMTLEALTNGAQDFVTKPKANSPEEASQQIRAELLPKVLQFAARAAATAPAPARPATFAGTTPAPGGTYLRKEIFTFNPRAVVIASSTGGPAAIENILNGIKGKPKIPILIAQHMPPVFTTTFAKRLGELTGFPAKEGAPGEDVAPGIYVAPGDFHMTVRKEGENPVRIFLDRGPARNSVRPAADTLFETAAKVWGPSLLGIVLTGMGEDGLVGSRALKQAAGGLVIQSEASCVVFGMPGAVNAEKLQDATMEPISIQALLKRVVLS
jgi:two-component system, chemotaxis family, protein-glutamate methylesterase/glutaminase